MPPSFLILPAVRHVEVELGLVQPRHGQRPDGRQLAQRRIGAGRVDRMSQPPLPAPVPRAIMSSRAKAAICCDRLRRPPLLGYVRPSGSATPSKITDYPTSYARPPAMGVPSLVFRTISGRLSPWESLLPLELLRVPEE
jgi:hypothetical protein